MKDPDADYHETAPAQTKSAPQTPPQRINDEQLNLIMKECDRTGVTWREVCKIYKVEKLSDMTVSQYKNCMSRFKATPDKAKETVSPPPDVQEDEGLPWNTPTR